MFSISNLLLLIVAIVFSWGGVVLSSGTGLGPGSYDIQTMVAKKISEYLPTSGGCGGMNNGEIYVFNPGAPKLYKLDQVGGLTVVAGNDVIRNGYFGGEHVPATTSIGVPSSCTVDSDGNVYVGDANSIRKIFTNGTMTTLAGNGQTLTIKTLTNGTLGLETALGNVISMTVASTGDVYFLEEKFHMLRMLNLTTGRVVVVAGSPGTKGNTFNVLAKFGSLSNPSDVFYDSQTDNILICDTDNNAVKQIEKTTGKITILFGANGLYAMDIALISSPKSIYRQRNGDIYVGMLIDPTSMFGGTSGVARLKNGSLEFETILGINYPTNDPVGSVYSRRGQGALASEFMIYNEQPRIIFAEETSGSYFFVLKAGLFKYETQDGRVYWVDKDYISHYPSVGTINKQIVSFSILNDTMMFAYKGTTDGIFTAKINEPYNKVKTYVGAAFQNEYYEGVPFNFSGIIVTSFNRQSNELFVSGMRELKRIDLSINSISRIAGSAAASSNDDNGGDGGLATQAYIDTWQTVRMPNNDIIISTPSDSSKLRIIYADSGIIDHFSGRLMGNCDPKIDFSRNVKRQNACLGTILSMMVHPVEKVLYLVESVGYSYTIIRKFQNDILSIVVGNLTETCNHYEQCGDGSDISSLRFPKNIIAAYIGYSPVTFEIHIMTSTSSDCRIRKIGKNGIVSTVAGFVGDKASYSKAGSEYDNFIPAARNTRFQCKSMDFTSSGEIVINVDNVRVIKFPNIEFDENHIRDREHDPRALSIMTKTGDIYEYDNALSLGADKPFSVFKTLNGDIYFFQNGGNTIRKLDAETRKIYSIIGNSRNSYLYDVNISYDYYPNYIPGLWVSESGEIYFTDLHRVRKLSSELYGTLTDIAGSRSPCLSTTSPCGDGGLATSALLFFPAALFIHKDGSIYFSDSGTHRIRKILTNGTIITVVGNGTICADSTSSCGDNDLATKAQLNTPNALFVTEGGDIYFADTLNHKIRLVTAATGKISTIAGNGFMATNESMSKDGGLPTRTSLNTPKGLTVTEDGTVIFTDSGSNYIRYVSADRKTINALSGKFSSGMHIAQDQGELEDARFDDPAGVFLLEGELLVADVKNGLIRSIKATCPIGYGGFTCKPICYGMLATNTSVCSSKGKCIDYNTCQCDSNYFGTTCENTLCNGIASNSSNVCSGHGRCVKYDTCVCNPGRAGSNCEALQCYDILSTSPLACSSHGKCVDTDTCICDSQYYGKDCNVTTCNSIPSNSSNVCNKKGSCSYYDICNCKPNYFGKACENTLCYGIQSNSSQVCSSLGICTDFNVCQCPDHYLGLNCSVTSCFGVKSNMSSVCSGYGSCVSYDACKCKTGFYGNDCSAFNCFGEPSNSSSVCSSNGKCTNYNTCVCNSNRYGSDCSVKKCYGVFSNSSSVCSGNGECNGYNQCVCKENYIGNTCQFPLCYSIPSNDSTVCSGRGVCSGANNCSCNSHYEGEKCEKFSCYGTLFNTTGVCSGHGLCTSPGKCECEKGYGGENCQHLICHGLLANDTNVCGSHGKCIAFDTCQCANSQGGQVFYNGTLCQNLYCYSHSSQEAQVCSGRGQCYLDATTNSGGCKCNDNYSGDLCEKYSCNGILSTDKTVCNSRGLCVAHDKCVCNNSQQDGFWGGSDCESCVPEYSSVQTGCKTLNCDPIRTCNGHGTCNSTFSCTCSGFWDGKYCSECKPNYFGSNCTIFCTPQSKCSSKGSCNLNGTCDCNYSQQTGYFGGSACDVCATGYYGKECFTKISGPVKFLDMFNGIKLIVTAPPSYSLNTVDCSKLIHTSYLSKMGTAPSCYWTNKVTGEFAILLGSDYTLKPNDYLKLNRLVFDGLSDYTTVQVLNAESPVTPIASIRSNSLISLCDSIILDGTGSYSGDMKPLNYNWSVISSPSNILSSIRLSTISILTLSSNMTTLPGIYQFSLTVESSISGKQSNPITFIVEKLTAPLPKISIVDLSPSTFYTSSSVLIKKLVSFPSCYYEDKSMTIVWKQTSGPAVDMVVDTNDNLLIRKFLTKGDQSYTFSVSATSKINSASTADISVSISTISKPLTLSVYSTMITNSSASISALFADLEGLGDSETWLWTCSDLTYGSSCSQSIIDALNSYSTLKSSTVSIPLSSYVEPKPTLRISLRIVKGSRSVDSNVDFIIPGVGVAPPTISLISLSPQKAYILKQSDIINIDLDITANNAKIDIDQYITRVWTLNGVLLSSTSPILNKMSKSPALSNSLVIDPSSLAEGSTYTIDLTVSDLRVVQKAKYSTSFTIATTPKPCPCTISPSNGIAFDTLFTLQCTNCQNAANSLKITYGFIDDKTLVEMALYSGVQSYATKLPSSSAPVTNPYVSVFFKIIDTNSGAFITQQSSVKVVLPAVRTFAEASRKSASWTSYAKSLIDGDPNKYVFSTTYISRATTALYSLVKAVRSLRTTVCEHGGKADDVTGKCTCPPGYYKADCSMGEELFNAFQQMRLDLLAPFVENYDSRNPDELMTESYLSTQAFDIDSFVENYDEINNYIFEKCFSIFKSLIEGTVQNQDASISSTISDLLINIVNSLYKYMVYTELEGMNLKVKELEMIVNKISKLALRAKFVGEKDITFTTPFLTLSTNKLYKNDFASLSINNGETNSIILPLEMPNYFTEQSTRKPLSYTVQSSPIKGYVSDLTQIYQNVLTIGNIRNETTIGSKKEIRSMQVAFSIQDSNINENCKNLKYIIGLDSNIDTDEKLITSTILQPDESTTISEFMYKKSIGSCAQYDNNTMMLTIMDPNECTLLFIDPNTAMCECKHVGSYVIVEEITYRRELRTLTNTIIPPQQKSIIQSMSVATGSSNAGSGGSGNNDGDDSNSIVQVSDVSLAAILIPILGGTLLLLLLGIAILVVWSIYQKRHYANYRPAPSTDTMIELKTSV